MRHDTIPLPCSRQVEEHHAQQGEIDRVENMLKVMRRNQVVNRERGSTGKSRPLRHGPDACPQRLCDLIRQQGEEEQGQDRRNQPCLNGVTAAAECSFPGLSPEKKVERQRKVDKGECHAFADAVGQVARISPRGEQRMEACAVEQQREEEQHDDPRTDENAPPTADGRRDMKDAYDNHEVAGNGKGHEHRAGQVQVP